MIKIRWAQAALLALAAATFIGCGGGGGGGGGSTDGGSGGGSASASFTVNWPERTTRVNAPAAALSLRADLFSSASASVPVRSVTRNRPSGTASAQDTVTLTNISPGTYTLRVTFFAQANAAGAIVATGQKTVPLVAGSNDVGDFTLTGTITTLELANQTVTDGQTVDLNVTAKNASGQTIAIDPGSVRWTLISGGNVVSLSEGGRLVALNPGTATLRASVDGLTSNTVTITVVAPGTVTIAVTPETASVITGGTQQFAATVTGNANTAVTWSVQGGSANGTISASGLYTAPSTPGTYTIVATSVADATKTDTATVTVGSALFLRMGDLPGGNETSSASGVDEDGNVVVGQSFPTLENHPAMWTPTGGLVELAGVGPGVASDVSNSGTIVVGTREPAGGGIQAFSWTQAGGVVTLPNLTGSTGSTIAFGISGDGSVVVGQARDAQNQFRAVAWTGGQAINLGVVPGGSFSLATDADLDGSVIVGQSAVTGGSRATRWVRNNTGTYNQPSTLPVLIGGSQALANAVNDDGTVIVGESGTSTPSPSHTAAFRWTSATGTVNLGDLAGGTQEARALGVSGDGSIVVGESNTNLGFEAFIWTAGGGMQNLKSVLTARGMGAALTGWTLSRATAISRDGRVIVGVGTNPNGQTEGWIAVLP